MNQTKIRKSWRQKSKSVALAMTIGVTAALITTVGSSSAASAGGQADNRICHGKLWTQLDTGFWEQVVVVMKYNEDDWARGCENMHTWEEEVNSYNRKISIVRWYSVDSDDGDMGEMCDVYSQWLGMTSGDICLDMEGLHTYLLSDLQTKSPMTLEPLDYPEAEYYYKD